jgi:hypothetical protein
MGIDVEATCTPRVERKAVAASTCASSYAEASEQLKVLGDISLGEKRVTRIVQRVGQERVAQREQQLKEFEELPLPQQRSAPPGVQQASWNNRVAAVFLDGGRAQLRDERWGQERLPGEKKPRWWRESKLSVLATLSSSEQAQDPFPEPPECLLDPLWLVPRLNEIKAAKGGESAAEQIDEALQENPATDSENEESRGRWSPPPLVRSVVGTFEPYDYLGRLTKAEAYRRGFAAADRKAFVADGLNHNWRLQQEYFSDWVAIADLLHALSYVYQAAKASTADMEECWRRCQSWITLTWKGKVSRVIEEIDELLACGGDPDDQEKLTESRRYLHNNRNRMRYDEYRRRGLPITTAIMESTVKRINRRIKGTEKFWGPTAEPQLQLCTDSLSETRPFEEYWIERAESRTGRRKSRTTR